MRNLKLGLLSALMLMPIGANAVSIYDNSIGATNINMLTVDLMKNAKHSDNLSLFLRGKNVYGNMTRIDEYGDDGSTIDRTQNYKYVDVLAQDVWADVDYVNTRMNYKTGLSDRSRLMVASVGFDSIDFYLNNGSILFGAFWGYVGGRIANFNTDGQTVGLFTKYDYQNFSVAGMIDTGAIRNDLQIYDFNNAWLNVAVDANVKIRLNSTTYLEPTLYFGYTRVTTDDNVRINGDLVMTNNFNFWNIAPSIKFVTQMSDNWYGGAFFKYVNTSDGKNDIVFQNITYTGIDIDNYSMAGINAEYRYNKFVFESTITKQMGTHNGWGGNINAKYLF